MFKQPYQGFHILGVWSLTFKGKHPCFDLRYRSNKRIGLSTLICAAIENKLGIWTLPTPPEVP